MALTETSTKVTQTTEYLTQKTVLSSTDDADTLSVALELPNTEPDEAFCRTVSSSGILAHNLIWSYDITTDGEADFITANEDAGTQTVVYEVWFKWYAQADQDGGSLDDF